MNKSDFDVMQQMSQESGDKIRMYGTVVNISNRIEYSDITIRTDSEVGHDASNNAITGNGKYIIALYAVDREEFLKFKKQEQK